MKIAELPTDDFVIVGYLAFCNDTSLPYINLNQTSYLRKLRDKYVHQKAYFIKAICANVDVHFILVVSMLLMEIYNYECLYMNLYT